ncbi:hypothetical protein niasHT_016139 [Heterodera trifolii]|uniref:Uncharacterized protein n=1 Tax=Heterodera trifolii TaxID=157864 RepID=A0ABD2LIK5_9BILA
MARNQSRRSSISTNATEDAEYSRRNSFGSVNLDHVYGNNFIQFGVPAQTPHQIHFEGAIDRRCIGRGGMQGYVGGLRARGAQHEHEDRE